MQVTGKYLYVGGVFYDFKTDRGERMQITKVTLIPVEMPKKDGVTGFQIDTFSAVDFTLFNELRKLQPLKDYEFSLDVDTSSKTPKVKVIGVIGEVKAA